MFHRPGGLTPADTKDEVAEKLFTARRVRHFRMKLHAKEAARRIGKRGDRRIAAMGKRLPAVWNRRHLIPVTHPHTHGLLSRKSMKQVGITINGKLRGSILTLIGLGDLATAG